ncbi:hypothetical protein INT46_005822 [Mucor plumbeus]|uniref:DUF4097 domain-containing protein n=1 Tax=Mucor plumbeus TaxID=97098 RepID=A0A8H7QBA7_9FUNG|nr:hypothetical protein INT46_005822 [Mucor plumbeus]
MPSKDSLFFSNKIEKEPFDLPPPYTPSDTASQASSSSNHYQRSNQYEEASSSSSGANVSNNLSPPPPNYDTVHEQHGFLSNNSNNNSFDQKGKAPSRDNYNLPGIGGINMRGITYDVNRGPIGNVLGLAGNIVGYTTSRALGVTSAATGAAFGTVGAATDIASTSVRNASNSARSAMGIVEEFVNAKIERRDERMRAKSLRKDQRCERREMKHEQREARKCQKAWGSCDRNTSDSYVINSNDYTNNGSQPHQAHAPYGSHQDSRKLFIKQSNKPFVFDRSWTGEECTLQTSNGHLSVHGSLTASDKINLETSNANITVDGQLMAKNSISIKTSNGVFNLQGPSISTKELKIITNNAPLNYNSFIEAKTIDLKTKNAPIILSTVSVGSELRAKTSNASVEIHINDIVSNSAIIEIESSNAPVNVHVPNNFSGYFSVKTSSSAHASVVAKNSENCELNFETDENNYNAGSSGYTSTPPPPQIVYKPDEVTSADLTPPPPYSPDRSDRNSEGGSSGYGSVRNSIEQQQHGLLAPSSPRNATSNYPPPKRVWNSHSDYQQLPPTSQSLNQEAVSPSLSILLWLVIYIYSGKLFSTPPSYGDGHYGCNSNAVTWNDIPNTIEFDDNVELVINGRVSNGLVTIIPLEDRHGGSILSDIQVHPPSLQDKMTFDVQHNYDGGDSTKLILQMPQNFENEDCISVNIEIRLPYAANRLFVNVKNIDVKVQPFVKDVDDVDVKTSNGRIDFGSWSGESLKLSTQDGELKVGRLTASGSVYLENANALVQLTENIDAKRMISVKNSNGAVEAFGSLRADNSVDIETSNAYIKLFQVFSDSVSVSNANNEIQVDYIEAKNQVLAKSSNGPVTISVGATKNNQVRVINSNAHVNLHMTKEFEGSFVLSTSHGEVTIENGQDIQYQDDLEYLKRGYRGERGKGDLVVETNNADVHVAFDME